MRKSAAAPILLYCLRGSSTLIKYAATATWLGAGLHVIKRAPADLLTYEHVVKFQQYLSGVIAT